MVQKSETNFIHSSAQRDQSARGDFAPVSPETGILPAEMEKEALGWGRVSHLFSEYRRVRFGRNADARSYKICPQHDVNVNFIDSGL